MVIAGALGDDGVEFIQVRWEDDGTESRDARSSDAIKVSDLDEPLAGGGADPEVSIGREAFVDACHAQSNEFPDRWSGGVRRIERPVEEWFEALRLELEEPGPGCISKAIASWPLRILCVASVVALLAQWLRDDGTGSDSFA